MSNKEIEHIYKKLPFFDPFLLKRNKKLFNSIFRLFLQIENQEHYNIFLNREFNALTSPKSLEENLKIAEQYLSEADLFICNFLDVLDRYLINFNRKDFEQSNEVKGINRVYSLLNTAFKSKNRKIAFEAQRKLYIAKLLFNIDNSQIVKYSKKNVNYFNKVVNEFLFKNQGIYKTIDIGYNISDDGVTMNYYLKDGKKINDNDETYRFHVRKIKPLNFSGKNFKKDDIFIFFYNIRHKREMNIVDKDNPAYYQNLQDINEKISFKRSFSILNKMIRLGVNNPNQITDILGAMFIVETKEDVEELVRTLEFLFGGSYKWYNIKDTINDNTPREEFNKFSSAFYEVRKGLVDIIYPTSSGDKYIFRIEIQIYTLDGYLRTIHSKHLANHKLMKLKQSLFGIFPIIFPDKLYGFPHYE